MINFLGKVNRYIKSFFDLLLSCCKLIFFHKKGKNAIVFIATPIYGNLGDHAIIRAQIMLMKDSGLGDRIIEIDSNQYSKNSNILKKFIHNNDLIVIDGGGNMGTLWLNEEYKMRSIVRLFENNPIIIFPQTAYFETSDKGKIELNKSISIYNNHNNLTIFCRDANTFKLVQNKMKNVKSYYVPDIVLYTYDAEKINKRDGILVIMRDDKEKINSINVDAILEKYCADMKIKYSTTMCKETINKKNRDKFLIEKWEEFSKSSLVITDRLHGMIFSAITGTPCIALDNKSHKVGQGYEWIKNLPYIYYCADKEGFISAIYRFNTCKNMRYKYSKERLNSYYTRMVEVIKNELRNE